MNFTLSLPRIVALSLSFWLTCGSVLAQDTPWWKGLFAPKSESVNVHAPAVPAPSPTADTLGSTRLPEPEQTSQAQAPSDSASISFGHADQPLGEIPRMDPGHFDVVQPAALDSLDSLWRQHPAPVRGYRLQVYLGDLTAARTERAKLRRLTTEPIYLQAMPPSYGLMVGDFRDKWAAERLRSEWDRMYPDALVIPTDIAPMALPTAEMDRQP